jgi:16S rRNA (uracil1498-N3)-methyltransferase
MTEHPVPGNGPRLFVDDTLAEGRSLALPAAQSHYLSGVMRLKAGDGVRLFDDRTGEWQAQISDVGRRSVSVTIGSRIAARETVPDLWLCAAPIKRGRIDWMAEKACELGVSRLLPVLTRRTVVDKLNLDRLRAHMIEAAEQCGRTALPEVAAPTTLAKLLDAWPADRQLVFCDEEGGAAFAGALKPAPAAILIGPEGGFDPGERAAIRALPQAVGVSIGPRILRADTAAVAAIALWQAAVGDWRT